MTQDQWQTLDRAMCGLSIDDKLELIERITHSIRVEAVESPGRAAWQRENLRRLRQELATMPVAKTGDGLSNRDHDQILYGKRS